MVAETGPLCAELPDRPGNGGALGRSPSGSGIKTLTTALLDLDKFRGAMIEQFDHGEI